MSSLFEELAGQLSGNRAAELGRRVGADPAKTEQAVPAALAALMGALARNTDRSDGAEALSGALARDHDGSLLDNLDGFLSGQGASSAGEAILGHVLGGNRQKVEQQVSQATGLDGGSTGQLLAMLAPIVLGALGKAQRKQGLGARDLSAMLGGERQRIRERAPRGMDMLGQLLDSDGDGDYKDDVARIGTSLLGSLFGQK